MTDGMTYEKAFTHPEMWGRWVESAVGCHLLDKADELEFQVYYWRENNEEVDFVITRGESIIAIEVKSGRRQRNSGMSVFGNLYHPKYSFVVGGENIPLEEFFKGDIEKLL